MIITSAPCASFFACNSRKEILIGADELLCNVEAIENLDFMGFSQIKENEVRELIKQGYMVLFLPDSMLMIKEMK